MHATYGSAGQMVAGISAERSTGFSNYHGGYVSFKTSGFRGLTLQENFTYAKALGTGCNNQSSSGTSERTASTRASNTASRTSTKGDL